MSVFSQIFNTTQNFLILPNFILCMSVSDQKSHFEPNLQHYLKFLDFAKFHILCMSLEMSVFSQIFNATQNFLILPNFIFCRFWVIKNFILSQIYNTTSLKFLDFAISYPLHVLSGQKSQFWAKFSTWLKISGICQISSRGHSTLEVMGSWDDWTDSKLFL